MRVHRPLLLLLAGLTAGCADPEPFVDLGTSSATIEKPVDPVLVTGSFKVCFSDATPWTEVEALANERCAARGLKVYSAGVTRWQCRATSPHTANFLCYDPEMVLPSGRPVNPFDPNAVAAWEKQTGKKAKPHNFMTGPGAGATPPAAPVSPAPAPAGAQPAAPPPAPVSNTPPPAPAAVAPLSPADIAGRPAMPAPPPPPSLPPAAPQGGAYPTDGFTLPQGSWGDHFQE